MHVFRIGPPECLPYLFWKLFFQRYGPPLLWLLPPSWRHWYKMSWLLNILPEVDQASCTASTNKQLTCIINYATASSLDNHWKNASFIFFQLWLSASFERYIPLKKGKKVRFIWQCYYYFYRFLLSQHTFIGISGGASLLHNLFLHSCGQNGQQLSSLLWNLDADSSPPCFRLSHQDDFLGLEVEISVKKLFCPFSSLLFWWHLSF